MADYNKRLQILLTEEQHSFLHQLARASGRSVGELVRDACDQVYRPGSSVREIQALEQIMSNPLPTRQV